MLDTYTYLNHISAPLHGRDCVYWSNLEYNASSENIDPLVDGGDDIVAVSPLLSYGDYDNSSEIERSNVRLFRDGFAYCKGTDWVDLFGSFGSNGIALLTPITNPEIVDCLRALDDYPCMDDEDVSAMAEELCDEAWDSWARHDFEREIESRFEDEGFEFDVDPRELFESLREDANEQWCIECGGSAYVDVDRIVRLVPVALADVLRFGTCAEK